MNFSLSTFLAAFVVSAGFWIFGEIYFRTHYAETEQAGLAAVKTRLDLFDMIVSRAERDLIVPGKAALLELGKRYSSIDEISRENPESLSAVAEELGVGEIYFVRKDGRVFASSLEIDIGLDLFFLGTRFAYSIKTL